MMMLRVSRAHSLLAMILILENSWDLRLYLHSYLILKSSLNEGSLWSKSA